MKHQHGNGPLANYALRMRHHVANRKHYVSRRDGDRLSRVPGININKQSTRHAHRSLTDSPSLLPGNGSYRYRCPVLSSRGVDPKGGWESNLPHFESGGVDGLVIWVTYFWLTVNSCCTRHPRDAYSKQRSFKAIVFLYVYVNST